MSHVSSRGCALAYTVADHAAPWGARRDPVVFQHGLGANADIWAEWQPALVARHRLVSYDMRGHGASAREGAADIPDLDALTDDLFAVMDAADVARAHLVGESIGGTIVLNAALRAPERVASVCVSNGAHAGGSIGAVRDWARIIDEGGMEAWSRHMMGQRFFPGAISPELAAWYEREQARTCPRTLLAGLAALVGTDLTARLGALRVPLLILHPDSSPFIPVALAAALKDAVADSRLNVIGHARHGMLVSHATECANLLAAFLETVERGDSR
jgi:pimeloyl-ACP methyl ester carboxylesterase